MRKYIVVLEESDVDFGRTNQQKQVVSQEVVERGRYVGSITMVDGIIDILDNNIMTNLNFDDMKTVC